MQLLQNMPREKYLESSQGQAPRYFSYGKTKVSGTHITNLEFFFFLFTGDLQISLY